MVQASVCLDAGHPQKCWQSPPNAIEIKNFLLAWGPTFQLPYLPAEGGTLTPIEAAPPLPRPRWREQAS